MSRFLSVLFGSFFYSGFFPFAPATFASAVWLAVWLFIPGGRFMAHPYALAATIPLSIYLSFVMERYYGEDASEIVIDEFVGMQVTFLMIQPSLALGVAGFFLFRFFDIVKPWPVGASQNLKGGYGVVADDILAGLYSRLVLFAFSLWI